MSWTEPPERIAERLRCGRVPRPTERPCDSRLAEFPEIWFSSSLFVPTQL